VPALAPKVDLLTDATSAAHAALPADRVSSRGVNGGLIAGDRERIIDAWTLRTVAVPYGNPRGG
jgi:hypothetical protein